MDELQKIKKKETITVENLWQVIESHQGETFLTVKHLPFTYTIKGGELFTDRKRKSITRSTFEKAYIRVQEKPESITGPKTLNVFGAPVEESTLGKRFMLLIDNWLHKIFTN